jgi:hypothetical protein
MTDTVTAVVAAGGRFAAPDAAVIGETIKAQARIEGETLLFRLLTVLLKVAAVRNIVVIGPEELKKTATSFGGVWTRETDTLLGNVIAATRSSGLMGDEPILLIGADMAFPSAASITDFLLRSGERGTVSAPVIARETYEASYPGSPSIFAPLREGQVTLGSQFVAPAGLLLDPPPAVAAILGHKKSQMQMARIFGVAFIVGLLTKQLTIPGLERRSSELLGVPVTAVQGCAADLAFDIDDARDYAYACKITSQFQA